MTIHRVPGLHPRSLATYLAALGLIRTLGHTDPSLRAHWHASELIIESAEPDLVEWLLWTYRPSPIVSPWNGGSGFGAKDVKSKQTIEAIRATSSPRIEELRAAIDLAVSVVERGRSFGWDKARTVSELRNRCPESLLGWLDACVIVRDNAAFFPPLLGTGGNDGRLDFSTNFHQRLLEVLPELGADPRRSEQWARDLLTDQSEGSLVSGAIGQFDPAAAGGRNSSAFGAANSLVNPWEFVLLIEGAMCFASGLARRQGGGPGRAAMPFCVHDSPDGPTPGAVGENSRGEIWSPIWNQPLSAREIGQLFVESRASWGGHTATQATQMYAALRSYGVSRGIDRFIRYGLHQRNGLAFSAVRLDDVEVQARSAVTLCIEPARVMEPFSRLGASAVVRAKRRFDAHQLAYARDVRAEDLRDLLAEQTLADLAVLRSTGARAALGRRLPRPRAERYVDFLYTEIGSLREFRLGAALASAGYVDGTGRIQPLRELIVGHLPAGPREAWTEPVIRGLGVRPLETVLADAVVWRSRHTDDAAGADRGFRPFPVSTVEAPWPDIHGWVSGQLDDEAVLRSFLACLALDWRGSSRRWRSDRPEPVPHPELAVLQAFASGRLTASGEHVESGDASHVGLQRDWPSRLLAEPQSARGASTGAVLCEAVALLDRLGWSAAPPLRTNASRERLVAALIARTSLQPLRRLGAYERAVLEPEAFITDPSTEKELTSG